MPRFAVQRVSERIEQGFDFSALFPTGENVTYSVTILPVTNPTFQSFSNGTSGRLLTHLLGGGVADEKYHVTAWGTGATTGGRKSIDIFISVRPD
jgi:hypothetical protein